MASDATSASGDDLVSGGAEHEHADPLTPTTPHSDAEYHDEAVHSRQSTEFSAHDSEGLDTPPLSTTEEQSADKVAINIAEPPAGEGHVDDLEAMVNLLESAKPRPISFVGIPDEVREIPDEE